MAAYKGRTLALGWGAGSPAIAGVRERSVAINGEPIDITTDEDMGWQTLLEVSAQDSVAITVSGVTKSNALKADYFNGDRTKPLTLTYPDGSILTGTFFLSTYTDNAPYNNAGTFEASFMSSGEVTFTPGV